MSSASQFMMRAAFVFACFTAGASVLIAAYSAHVPGLEESSVRSVNSAIQMMQFHALVLLVASWMNQAAKAKWLLIASILFFVLGLALFSFNIVCVRLGSFSNYWISFA